jgi:hypothetical protein
MKREENGTMHWLYFDIVFFGLDRIVRGYSGYDLGYGTCR